MSCAHAPTDVQVKYRGSMIGLDATCGLCGASLSCVVEHDDWEVVKKAGRKVSVRGTAPVDWVDAVAAIDDLFNLIVDLPDRAADFGIDIHDKAGDMQDWIRDHQHVTAAQQSAIENWTRGVRAWLERD